MRSTLAVFALAVAACLVYGYGFVNVDAMSSLVWGRQLSLGQLPFYPDAAPTPHPLSNAVGLLLAPLHDGAEDGLLVISYASAGGLVWATWLVGQRLFGTAAGVVSAVLVFSREVVVVNTARAFLDVPFAALVMAAIAMEVRAPRRGAPVLAVLGVAGLIRPEAWFLTGLYWLWMLPAVSRAEAMKLAALGAAAPVIWMACDLVVTGNPLYGFTETREVAAALSGVPSGLDGLLTAGPVQLASNVRRVVVFAAVVGLVVALRVRPGATRKALVITVAVALSWAIPAALGTVPNVRYAIPTVAMLCVLAASGLAILTAEGRALGKRWQALALASAVLLAVSVPSQVARVLDERRGVIAVAENRAQLKALVESRPLPCAPVVGPNPRVVPPLVIWRRLEAREQVADQRSDPSVRRGTFVAGTHEVSKGWAIHPRARGGNDKPEPLPAGARVIARGGGWTLGARC